MAKKVKEEVKIKKQSKKKTSIENIKVLKKVKKPNLNKELKPYMDFLGVLRYKAAPLDYYTGENKLYIIESDYLETFVLKIFNDNAYKFAASIEKHFITNAKNISKRTPDVNVAHDKDENLSQFLFTDRLAGANKKWTSLNSDDKSKVIKEIAKYMFKIHTYHAKKIMKEEIWGKVSDPQKSWDLYLKEKINNKIQNMKDQKVKTSDIIKFEKYCESKMPFIATSKIESVLLHGSISLNDSSYIRSLLFLGNNISGVVNSEESIYGDRIWDLISLYMQILEKNKTLEKDFFGVYGKLKDEEKERLAFYKEILSD